MVWGELQVFVSMQCFAGAANFNKAERNEPEQLRKTVMLVKAHQSAESDAV